MCIRDSLQHTKQLHIISFKAFNIQPMQNALLLWCVVCVCVKVCLCVAQKCTSTVDQTWFVWCHIWPNINGHIPFKLFKQKTFSVSSASPSLWQIILSPSLMSTATAMILQSQKSRPSSNLWVIAPGVYSPKNVALDYDVGKISAGCLVCNRFVS